MESPWRSINTVFLLIWFQTESPPTAAVVCWSMFNNGLSGVGGGDEAQSIPFPRCPVPLMAISSHPRDDGDRGVGRHKELRDLDEPATGPLRHSVLSKDGATACPATALLSCDCASGAPPP